MRTSRITNTMANEFAESEQVVFRFITIKEDKTCMSSRYILSTGVFINYYHTYAFTHAADTAQITS